MIPGTTHQVCECHDGTHSPEEQIRRILRSIDQVNEFTRDVLHRVLVQGNRTVILAGHILLMGLYHIPQLEAVYRLVVPSE